MEENKKIVYLEEAEEVAGQRLDRYGLTPEQRKQYKKDNRPKNLEKIIIISVWLLLGVLTGVVLLLLRNTMLFDEVQRKNMNVAMCFVAGLCWWGMLILIFLKPIKRLFKTLSEKLKKKDKLGLKDEVVKYEVLPFIQSNGSPAHSHHKDFIRCPICGHKLEIIDSYSNNGKIYEKLESSEITPATPLEEHTSYKCFHCSFSFKACYKGEYKFNTRNEDNSKHTIVHTNEIVSLNENVKMDSEAKKILKPYIGKKTTNI